MASNKTKTAPIEQRVALVTGAVQGIGAACAKRLAQDGCAIAVNYHSTSSADKADAVVEEIKTSFGVPAVAIQADVANSDAVSAMVDEVKSAFGRLDILVNNAGITRDTLLMRMKPEQFDDVIDTNLGGTFNCMRQVVPIMVKQRQGRIVNISSIVGIYGNAGQVNYAASKAGIIGMTKSAAKELGSRNITVNAVAPGFITTAMTEKLDDAAEHALTSRIASGRLGSPEDVAAAVAFLASEEASYITGQVLGVDGGLSI